MVKIEPFKAINYVNLYYIIYNFGKLLQVQIEPFNVMYYASLYY